MVCPQYQINNIKQFQYWMKLKKTQKTPNNQKNQQPIFNETQQPLIKNKKIKKNKKNKNIIYIIITPNLLINLSIIQTTMKRTSQSLYQSNTKQPPITTSKAFQNSNLYKSSGIFTGQGSIKKIQGQDLIKSDKINKKNYQHTIHTLKNKPTQKVLEDQYIGGLQQQIKYLQYELKLLKDKEIIEREGVNELDNFLKDQIPINENILAIKNKYNQTKSTLQGKYKNLCSKITQAKGVLNLQQTEVQRYHQCIDSHRKQTTDRKNQFKQKLSEQLKELSFARDESEYLLRENKQKHEQIKLFNEDIATLQRKQQKQKIQQVREVQNKQKAKQKFNEQFKLVKDDLVQALQKIDELQSYGENNPLLEPLQQQNSNLKKRIILNDKQISTAQNIIAEIQLHLKEDQREREIERQQKGKLTSQSQIYRTSIQHLQRYVETLIKDQTSRLKNKLLKEMAITLSQKQENYELLVDRLRTLQGQCTNLIQQRKQLMDALDTEKHISRQLDDKNQKLETSTLTCRSHNDAFNRLTAQVQTEIPVVKGDLQKCRVRIPITEKDIEKKKVILVYLNKQVQLLKELKTLDLQQLQMISQGGANMQNTLYQFIKNWEKIKTL